MPIDYRGKIVVPLAGNCAQEKQFGAAEMERNGSGAIAGQSLHCGAAVADFLPRDPLQYLVYYLYLPDQ